jgi:RNA polymerase sigma factor (TIGR02999 family)
VADVTELLHRWSEGDASAFNELMPIVYHELKTLAHNFVRKERVGATLDTNGLVHEAFISLVNLTQVNWNARPHFFGAAARIMRRLLVDHARARLASKRGSGIVPGALHYDLAIAAAPDLDVVALDIALEELAEVDPERARLVEIRHFGGLSMEETAEVMGISLSTANRDWAVARAWLFRRLRGQPEKS